MAHFNPRGVNIKVIGGMLIRSQFFSTKPLRFGDAGLNMVVRKKSWGVDWGVLANGFGHNKASLSKCLANSQADFNKSKG